jgi:SAM-dependent methyltransferase
MSKVVAIKARSAEQVRALSIRRYRAHANEYDSTCAATWSYRERAIAELRLKAGSTVLDAGCGTGLSFGLLREAVGDSGLVIGVEQSPDMAVKASQRIRESGWTNVRLFQASAHDVKLNAKFDAVLLNYTHDICRCPISVANLLSQTRGGGRIGMAGIKYFPRWLFPLNLIVYLKNRPYNGAPGDLCTPWDIVQQYAPDLQVTSTQAGMGYVAGGTLTQFTW